MTEFWSEAFVWAFKLTLLFGSIIVHEIAHGYAALMLGDTTARDQGRLTLNPIKHVDPFGTIILPGILLLASGGAYAFGYAKPVPINPWRFKNRKQGMLITGIAGPAVNVVIGISAALVYRFFWVQPTTDLGVILWAAVDYLAFINLILAAFNLIPIPPLDGSRVLQRFLPDALRDAYHRLEPYGFVIIMGISYLFPSVLWVYLDLTAGTVLRLVGHL